MNEKNRTLKFGDVVKITDLGHRDDTNDLDKGSLGQDMIGKEVIYLAKSYYADSMMLMLCVLPKIDTVNNPKIKFYSANQHVEYEYIRPFYPPQKKEKCDCKNTIAPPLQELKTSEIAPSIGIPELEILERIVKLLKA